MLQVEILNAASQSDTEGTVDLGTGWRRCRVHFRRTVLARVSKQVPAMVAATERTIREQASRAAVQTQLLLVIEPPQTPLPAARAAATGGGSRPLDRVRLPSRASPADRSNRLEQLNKELTRRSTVVGIFPNRGTGLRLCGAWPAEHNGEWVVGHRYVSKLWLVTDELPAREVEDQAAHNNTNRLRWLFHHVAGQYRTSDQKRYPPRVSRPPAASGRR